jgi:hypothetical protein
MIHAHEKMTTMLSLANAAAIKNACSLVAPNWPLDQLIAVNPLWQCRDQSIEQASSRFAALVGAKSTMSGEFFLDAYRGGRISNSSLIKSAKKYDSTASIDQLKQVLTLKMPDQWLSIAEIADLDRDHHKMMWQDEIVQQISQFCGDYSNQNGSSFKGLYLAWLEFSRRDYGVSLLMGEKNLRQSFNSLPNDYESLFSLAINELNLDTSQLGVYAHKLLLSINGWSSYLAWQSWQGVLEKNDNDHLIELLAVRLAWDLVIWRSIKEKNDNFGFLQLEKKWLVQKKDTQALLQAHLNHLHYLWIWSHAAELEYQTKLHKKLERPHNTQKVPPILQAVFCIDVRSERIRRSLESQHENIQTIGFAGFFGMAISYQPAGSDIQRPQLPGLLSPQIIVREQNADNVKLNKIDTLSRWKSWANAPFSAFTMVESTGWLYAVKLLKDNFLSQKNEKLINEFSHQTNWYLESNGQPLNLDDKVKLAMGILKAMGLTHDFAPIVLLLGHGSQTRNNLHASGLDCGACGGQTGEVNARVLAFLLNDIEIRTMLSDSEIVIPNQTRFIAGLHNTTTDEITCFDTLNNHEIETYLQEASSHVRRERVKDIDLKLLDLDDKNLKKSLIKKAQDWSEIRPEWGLVNNASFIVAPRIKTRQLDLEGRAFLHDYDWHLDDNFKLLEQIMTAPMLVTHWINMQYNFSVTDNTFFGSGNKLLHNAVGQHIGVFEGNGGDLRIGLPLQSVHDGAQWRHEALRLSVYIAAPSEAIDKIIVAHTTVRELINNNWLFLFRLCEDNTIECYRHGHWELV